MKVLHCAQGFARFFCSSTEVACHASRGREKEPNCGYPSRSGQLHGSYAEQRGYRRGPAVALATGAGGQLPFAAAAPSQPLRSPSVTK